MSKLLQHSKSQRARYQSQNERPAFNIEDDIYVSAGFIPSFRDSNNKIYYMLQKRADKPHYEDLGGKSDPTDQSIDDIVIRETLEELNFIAPKSDQPDIDKTPFDQETLPEIIKQADQILIPKSKYVLYLTELDFRPEYLDTDHYANAELDKNGNHALSRTIHFLTREEIGKVMLHPRLNGCLKFILGEA